MVSSLHLLEFETLHNYGREKDRIEVPVTLRSGEESISFPAQLDTGATYCVFERSYGEILGLSVESGTLLRFTTAMGSFDAYAHTLSLETLGYSFDSTVYFAAHDGFRRNVLGRRGWIDHLRIGLIEYKSKLYLNRSDE